MRRQTLLRISIAVLFVGVAFSGLLVAPPPASALPGWLTPTPAAPNEPQPRIIELSAPSAPDCHWTVVQWQSGAKWFDVSGWQGPLDANGKIQWGVAAADFGHGPFRWLVYEKRGGRLWGTSANFNLPTSAETGTFVTVSPAAGVTSASTANAIRLQFPAQATVGSATGTLQPGQTQLYVLKAMQGQPMWIDLSSPNNDVTLSLTAPGGAILLSASAKQSAWRGRLPATGDYAITVMGGAASESFNLMVTVAARVQFARGADSATVTGKTRGGNPVTFVVSARQGQVLTVDLGSGATNAAVAVWGLADSRPDLRNAVAQTSFSLGLPSTQDYVIAVVPRVSAALNYTLVVTIR